MARQKDSIQRLLDKGNTAEEIVQSGKYTLEEVEKYLNSDDIDSSQNDEGFNSDPDKNDSEREVTDEDLEAATEVRAEDVREIQDINFNPAKGTTKSEQERSYTKVQNTKNIVEVPEVFDKPNITDLDSENTDPNSPNGSGGTGASSGDSGGIFSAANPKLASATEDAKRTAAEKLWDIVIVPVYKTLCEVLPVTTKFGDNKVRKMAALEEIDLNMPMSWVDSDGNVQDSTLQEIINQHNRESDIAFQYDQEFVDQAKEPTIREFIKKGWGITDDDELKWILIMKLISIGQNVIQLNIKKFIILSEAKVSQLEEKKLAKDRQSSPPHPHQQFAAHSQAQNPPQPSFTPPQSNNDISDVEVLPEVLTEDHEQH